MRGQYQCCRQLYCTLGCCMQGSWPRGWHACFAQLLGSLPHVNDQASGTLTNCRERWAERWDGICGLSAPERGAEI